VSRGAALVAGLLCLSACGVQPESSPRTLHPSSAPFINLPRPDPAASGRARTLLYLVKDGGLVAVTRRVSSVADQGVVLAALIAGPSAEERDAGLSSAVPAGLTVHARSSASGLVQIEVPAAGQSETGRSDEVLAYAQVVCTLSGLPGVTAVTFVRDGQPLPVPRADGSLTSMPLSRRDYASLL
jgi:spore germination protein GerM